MVVGVLFAGHGLVDGFRVYFFECLFLVARHQQGLAGDYIPGVKCVLNLSLWCLP